MTSERADSFSDVQCIGLRFQPHRNAAFGRISVLERRYYSCGSRIGQILHTRLRLECSSLNSHLYRKNIIDDPFRCSCGGFESTYHFLFTCSNYNTQRNAHLPDDLHNYSTNDLLYGREQLSEQDNESLFLRVQEFIVKSERFRPTKVGLSRSHLHFGCPIT